MAQTSFDKSTNEDTTIPDALKWMWNNPKKAGMTALEMTPIIGDTLLAKDAVQSFSEGDIKGGLIDTAALGVGLIPVVGDITAKGIKQLKHLDFIKQAVSLDSPNVYKNLFHKDTNFAKEYGGELKSIKSGSEKIPISLTDKELIEIQKDIKKLTQYHLKDLPDNITVYRYGDLDTERGVSSFTLDPNYNASLNLPWEKRQKNPMQKFKVNKKDVLVSPDINSLFSGGRSFDEKEIIISNDKISKMFNKGGLGTAQTKYPSTAYLNPDLQQSTAIPDAIGSAVKWLFPSDKKEELSDVEKYVGDPRLLERGRPAPVEASQYDASKYGPEDVTKFLYEFSPAYAPEAARLAKEYGGKEGWANKAMGWLHAFDAATALIPVAGGASRKMVTDPAKFVLKRSVDTTALANKKSDYKGALKEYVSNQKSINKFFRNNDSRMGMMFDDERKAFQDAIKGKDFNPIPYSDDTGFTFFNKNLGRHQSTISEPQIILTEKPVINYDAIVNEIKKVRQSLINKGYSEDQLNDWARKVSNVETRDLEGRRRILVDTIEEPLLKEYEKFVKVSRSIYTTRKDYLKVLQDTVDLIESDLSKGIDFNDAGRNFDDDDLYTFMELGYVDQNAPWEDLTSFFGNNLGKHASDIRDIRTHLNTNYTMDINLLGKELDVKYNKNAEEIVDSLYNKTAKYIGLETGKPIFNSITQFIEELPDDMSASKIMELLEKNKNSFPKSQLALFKKHASSGPDSYDKRLGASKLDLLETSKKVGQDFDIKFHPEQTNIGQRISVVNSKSNKGYGITIHSDSAKIDPNLKEYSSKFQHFGGTDTGNLGHSRGAVIEAPLDGEMQKFILIEEFQSDTLKKLDIDITANKTVLKKRKEELEDFYSRRPSAIDTPNVLDKKTIEDYEKQIKFLNDKIAELTEIKKTFPSHEEYIYQQLLGHIKYASENGIDKIVIPKLTGESTVKNLYKKLNDFIIQRPKVEEPDFRNLVEKDILEETVLLQGMSRDQKNIYDKAIKADDDFVDALTYGKVDTKLFEDYPQLGNLPKYFWHDFLKNTSKQIELTSPLGDKKILGINDTEIERLLAKSWTTNGEIVREALGPEASISLLTKMLAEHHPHVKMRGAGGGLKPDSALKIYDEGLNNAIKRLLQKEKFPVTETALPEVKKRPEQRYKTELTHNIRRSDSHLDIEGGLNPDLDKLTSPSTSDVIILDLSSFLQKYDPATDALRFNKGGLAMEKQMELAFTQ